MVAILNRSGPGTDERIHRMDRHVLLLRQYTERRLGLLARYIKSALIKGVSSQDQSIPSVAGNTLQFNFYNIYDVTIYLSSVPSFLASATAACILKTCSRVVWLIP